MTLDELRAELRKTTADIVAHIDEHLEQPEDREHLYMELHRLIREYEAAGGDLKEIT